MDMEKEQGDLLEQHEEPAEALADAEKEAEPADTSAGAVNPLKKIRIVFYCSVLPMLPFAGLKIADILSDITENYDIALGYLEHMPTFIFIFYLCLVLPTLLFCSTHLYWTVISGIYLFKMIKHHAHWAEKILFALMFALLVLSIFELSDYITGLMSV